MKTEIGRAYSALLSVQQKPKLLSGDSRTRSSHAEYFRIEFSHNLGQEPPFALTLVVDETQLTPMKTTLHFQQKFSSELPKNLRVEDNRFSEPFLEHFIEEYTSPGDGVFDPFAGFGTTLIVAEKLGRVGFGVELNDERHAYASSQIENTNNLVSADVRAADFNEFPRFALSISSPIYMHRHEHMDPLTGFTQPGTYDSYLAELTSIYTRVANRLQQGGHLLIEAANLKGDRGVTTFAWDLCAVLQPHLNFAGEIVIAWDQYGYGYDHSYCLVFTRPENG